MRRARSFLLLEVVAALALLAGLGVWLLKLEAEAVRQYRTAQQIADVAARVEQLLWTWRETGAAVTLPATGQFSDRLHWRREVRPIRIATGVIPTQVTLVVTRHEPHGEPHEIYRVDWLVPQATPRDRP